MNVNSKLRSLRGALPGLRSGAGKDPRILMRVVLGLLLVANLVAALLLMRPWAASPQELEQRLGQVQSQAVQVSRSVDQLRTLVEKSRLAREMGDNFLSEYFMDRRTASSTIVGELKEAADASGVRQEEHTFSFEPIEGSDNLSMMTISGNYQGQYADLVKFINRLDRSPRFLILDTLTASPERTAAGALTMNFKINAFVIEGVAPAPSASGCRPLPLQTA